MNAKTLRNSILKYAMQGKLVLQDNNDEPSSTLLEKIKTEKKELVKQKVIKKEKELPQITAEEMPFDIPKSWQWVRIKELGFIFSGGTPKTAIPDYWNNDGLLWITPSDMGKVKEKYINSSSRKISQEGLKSSSAQLIPKDSIVYSSRAPIGHINIVEETYATNQGCKSIHPLKAYTDINFLYYALKFMTPWIQKKASGTTFKEISGTVFGESVIPFPPIEEQRRIVDKIDVLDNQIDIYGKLYEENEIVLKKFPIDLEKSILQYAMQGKLVPQDNNDEPARILIEKFKKEKEELVKQKIIKKDKESFQITKEEIPFEIPKNWEWVRLGEIGFSNIGVTYSPSNLASSGTAILKANNIFNNSILLNEVSYVDMQVRESQILREKDILICVRSGSEKLVGKSALVTKEAEGMSFGAFMAIYRSPFNEYIQHVISSSLFRLQLTKSRTTTINQITQGFLKEIIIPLPPLREQERIVKKINELLNKTKEFY